MSPPSATSTPAPAARGRRCSRAVGGQCLGGRSQVEHHPPRAADAGRGIVELQQPPGLEGLASHRCSGAVVEFAGGGVELAPVAVVAELDQVAPKCRVHGAV